ncbi:MAG TPA: SGNH/GDSL hydrolase family protein [Mucilaginibacter sp.]|jgi:lysophospholipase L1-like esterase|nr:SGNH/GDSL hydrolase family protein [Mucilaginibacter sp.]
MSNRREFIKTTVAATAASALLPWMAEAETIRNKKKIKLADNAVVLFQGDSITDAGRDKNNMDYNTLSTFGNGYASLVAAQLLYDNPAKKLKIYNKGISGNKVFQLANRWDKDCLEIKPDVLSIMVGVNDFWHTLTANYKGTIQTYKDDYVKLLNLTKDKLPDVQLIIGEPYGVKGIRAVDDKWYPAFDEYRNTAREIADRFSAIFIPLQTIFDHAQEAMPGNYWTADGVHPSFAGIQIMATAWLATFNG